MRKKFCIVTMPRSYSTAVCRTIIDQMDPYVAMPGPPEVGYELLHFRYIADVADLYRIPLNYEEREFIDTYFDTAPMGRPSGVRGMLSSIGGRADRTHFVGFKSFPFFHFYNEFFDRPDVTFIVLHRRSLDIVFLSWCVSVFRDEYGTTFDDKVKGFRFEQVAGKGVELDQMMRGFLFNLRVLSDLTERGAIDLVVDGENRVLNNPRLDEYFGKPIDFSVITHRSDYSALPDMDLFQERFTGLLDKGLSRSDKVPSLVEEFRSGRSERRAVRP